MVRVIVEYRRPRSCLHVKAVGSRWVLLGSAAAAAAAGGRWLLRRPGLRGGFCEAQATNWRALIVSCSQDQQFQRMAAVAAAPTPSVSCSRLLYFVRTSLAVNIAVLVAVCTVLIAFSSSEPVIYSWGPPTAGRGILLSVYFSILILSVLLLVLHVRCADKAAIEHMVAALLAAQIFYKITTPATAGPSNPVAISNLCISALHAVTLYLIWQRHKGGK